MSVYMRKNNSRFIDRRMIDSTGAFLISELDRLDQKLHEPLWTVTWGRDVPLRSDVTIADEYTSFMRIKYASPGGITPAGKHWLSGDSTTIPGIAVDLEKETLPMHPWGMELGYSIFDLAKSQQLNRSIDAQKQEGIRISYQKEVDEMVYIGDTEVKATGLVNNPDIPIFAISAPWTATTPPDQILTDINEFMVSVWEGTGYTIFPATLLLPPQKLALLTRPVGIGGEKSIMNYVIENALATQENNRPLQILSVRWLKGRGVGSADRMMAYTNDVSYLRYPLVPIDRTPLQFKGIYQIAEYYAAFGHLEFIYPSTVGYADGI